MNELTGRQVDPVVHWQDDGQTHIEWPEGTTDGDWVKVSVPLLRQMNDELNTLRRIHDVHLKGSLRIRSGWCWCERKNADSSWTMEFVSDPDLSAWEYVSPVLFDDGDNRATPPSPPQETEQ